MRSIVGLVVGLMLSCFSLSVWSATLTVSPGIELIAINGEIAPEAQQWPLNLGQTDIIVRYDAALKQGNKNQQFTSKPYIVTLNVQGDVAVTPPVNTRQYRKMAYAFRDQTPQWQLKDSKGEAIAFTQVVLPGKNGFAPYQDMPAVVAAFYQQPASVAIEQHTSAQQSLKLAPNGESEALSQLKLWYQQATPSDRQAFVKWLEQQ